MIFSRIATTYAILVLSLASCSQDDSAPTSPPDDVSWPVLYEQPTLASCGKYAFVATGATNIRDDGSYDIDPNVRGIWTGSIHDDSYIRHSSLGHTPAISRDGFLLAYVDRGAIHITHLDSTVSYSLGGAGSQGYPAWSPCGNYLYYAYTSSTVSSYGIVRISIQDAVRDTILSLSPGVAFTHLYADTDSSLLTSVPLSSSSPGQPADLYRYDSKTEVLSRLTSSAGAERYPSLVSGGTLVLYEHKPLHSPYRLCSISLFDQSVRVLASPCRQPTAVVDCDIVVYTAPSSGLIPYQTLWCYSLVDGTSHEIEITLNQSE